MTYLFVGCVLFFVVCVHVFPINILNFYTLLDNLDEPAMWIQK